MAEQSFEILEVGTKRIIIHEGEEYETDYSKKFVELIVKRKGISRAIDYFNHGKVRPFYIKPLFEYLEANGKTGLKVLEVGCSSGYMTEFVHSKECVAEIQAFDVDPAFVEIARLVVEERNLNKVTQIDHYTTQQTRSLPMPSNYFDLVIASAVVEHLPVEGRWEYVDEYYRVLKTGGLIGFFDTPNRHFPYEWHTVQLPFVNRLSPQLAYIITKNFQKRHKNVSFPSFMRSGTAWTNVSYSECLPVGVVLDVTDVSEKCGYGYPFIRKHRSRRHMPYYWFLRWISNLLGFPFEFYLPNLQLVFEKGKNYDEEI